MKLTRAVVEGLTLPAGKVDAIFFDEDIPGFGLRMRAGSPRSEARWCVQYKIGDKHRRLTFGKLSELDPAKARDKARDLLSAVRLGGDPAGTKLEERARADETFGAIVERFLVRQEGRLRPSSFSATRRYLERACKPLHRLALVKVTRTIIAARLSAIAGAKGPVSADRCRAALGAFFTWAMREGLCDANPTIATNKHSDAKARDRVLSEAELAEVWAILADDEYGAILKLLMLTGQRREEIGGLCWSEIALDKGAITLAGSRTKNGEPHDIPLSAMARAIIERRPQRAGRDLVFGTGQGGFSGWSNAKEALDERILDARKAADRKAKPMPAWRLHDLRRSAATHMAEIGVPPHIIEAILNHISGHKSGVAGTYNRASYGVEKAAALNIWADRLRSIVEGASPRIVSLRRGIKAVDR
jgi:integrase